MELCRHFPARLKNVYRATIVQLLDDLSPQFVQDASLAVDIAKTDFRRVWQTPQESAEDCCPDRS
jgi:hypothetical protein